MPTVAANAPKNPACSYPIKVAQLMAMGPGVDSAITVIFIISSWEIHFFFSTQQLSIMEIKAKPPPKDNRPMVIKVTSKTRNKCHFICFSIPSAPYLFFSCYHKPLAFTSRPSQNMQPNVHPGARASFILIFSGLLQ